MNAFMYTCARENMCTSIRECAYICIYTYSVCVFNTHQMLGWSICLFPLCFKSGKSMFPILCAEGLHGTYEHINLRQVSLIEEAY